ncbi:MAG: hypothetical protein HWD85_10670 [Flavobacteriaceae bacterium]|nr:hypothetical protein [Flavobacteriaceae bacterium]
MKLKKLFLVIAIGILFANCNKEKSIKEYMVATWETTYLKIEMPTFQKSDSTSVFEDQFLNNPPRRARSKYNNDGTFTAWFVNHKNEKSGTSKGTWTVKNDSLFIAYFYGGRDVEVAYHIEKTEEGFIGKSTYDWDEDGEFDDFLVMKTKRITAKQ